MKTLRLTCKALEHGVRGKTLGILNLDIRPENYHRSIEKLTELTTGIYRNPFHVHTVMLAGRWMVYHERSLTTVRRSFPFLKKKTATTEVIINEVYDTWPPVLDAGQPISLLASFLPLLKNVRTAR